MKLLWDEDTRNGSELHVILMGSSPPAGAQGTLREPGGPLRDAACAALELRGNAGRLRLEPGTAYPARRLSRHDATDRRPRKAGQLHQGRHRGTTVSRDILSLTDVRRPALLRRLFELACSHCAEVLSYNKMLGQMQDANNVTTLVHYLGLLGDAGMARGLQKYGGEVRRRSSSPKLQPMDTGLVTASSSLALDSWKQEPGRWGRPVECAVGAHLCNWAFSSGRHDVFYWMERNQEVDFVVPHEGRLFAIEVKSGRVPALHGMERIVKSHSPAVALLVGTGGIPLEEFLSKPPTAWFMT